MTVLSPRNTARFTVIGENEQALHEEAVKMLAAFAAAGTNWDFTIDATAAEGTLSGQIELWHGEVYAWRLSRP